MKPYVNRVERRFSQLALTIQHAPTVADELRDGQDAVAKPDQQAGVEPRLQLSAPPALRHHDQSLADFTDSRGAQKSIVAGCLLSHCTTASSGRSRLNSDGTLVSSR